MRAYWWNFSTTRAVASSAICSRHHCVYVVFAGTALYVSSSSQTCLLSLGTYVLAQRHRPLTKVRCSYVAAPTSRTLHHRDDRNSANIWMWRHIVTPSNAVNWTCNSQQSSALPMQLDISVSLLDHFDAAHLVVYLRQKLSMSYSLFLPFSYFQIMCQWLMLGQ